MKNLSNLIKEWKIKAGGIVVLSLTSLFVGCNENYLMGAAAQGYGIRSGTVEGISAGAALSEYFINEGNRQTALDSSNRIIIINQAPIQSPKGMSEKELDEIMKKYREPKGMSEKELNEIVEKYRK